MAKQTRLRNFFALPSWQRGVLVEAAFRIPLVELGLRTRGLQKIRRKIQKIPLGSPPISDSGTADQTASRIAGVVSRASHHGVAKGRCLSRSLVLLWILRRHGIDAELKVGVRQGNEVEGHAWVEYQAKPLNDTADVSQRYEPFPAL